MGKASSGGRVVIKGTPVECGSQAFQLVREVFIEAIKGQPAEHVASFYNGMLAEGALSMAEDLSPGAAALLLRKLADGMDTMGGQINAKQKH